MSTISLPHIGLVTTVTSILELRFILLWVTIRTMITMTNSIVSIEDDIPTIVALSRPEGRETAVGFSTSLVSISDGEGFMEDSIALKMVVAKIVPLSRTNVSEGDDSESFAEDSDAFKVGVAVMAVNVIKMV